MSEQFVAEYLANAARLEAAGIDLTEHDACGVGLVAALDGKPRREVVTAGIDALKVLWHRGAVDADGKTGDGTGIHVELPQEFFKAHVRHQGHEPVPGRLAIGMIFLPKTDLGAQETCRCIVETEILAFGYTIYGWRQVPVNVAVIGEKANATRPEIEQILVANSKDTPEEKFETDLYLIRRRIEKRVLAEHITDFYICSLSCRSVIYKGMFLAEQLTTFYPDLLDERFVSRFAMKLEEIKNKTNEAVSYLVAALESGQSDILMQYLNAIARFHKYSFGNIMLIARQKPEATNVAGIRTWNSLGRFVKRGEKGILILAPMIGRKKTDGVAESTADAKEATAQLYGFRAVYVFDLSQTEGKDLPALTEVLGDVSGYRERLVKFVEGQNVTLNYSERIAPAKGLSFGGKITLLSGMQPAEEFSTLVHEIAHEMLHRGARRTLTTKHLRETEAEAVAFVVCQSVGLQTGTASADYIQLWHGDSKLLQESLEVVQQTAAVILGAISPEDNVAAD